MKAVITVLTLGVDNLNESFRFYRDLGFPSKGIIGSEFENGSVAFFDMNGGLRLALWPKASLAADSGLGVGNRSSLEFSLGHNVDSKEEVDQIMEKASRIGAEIVKAPSDTFYGGYAGYFLDPDKHLWEIVWNPGLAEL